MGKIKYWASVFGMIIIILFFSACKATPKEKAVVDKSQGLPKGAAIDAIKAGEEKKFDAPEHWTAKKRKESKDGTIIMNVDVDVVIPKISNTPVLEFEQKKLSEERLKELVDYFSRGEKLFPIPQMTKTELETHKTLIENSQGIYKIWARTDKSNMLDRINEGIEQAPISVEKKSNIAIKFSKYEQEVLRYVISGKEKRFDTDKEVYFKALIDKEGVPGQVNARTYDKNAGTSSEFNYQCGAIYTEEDLSNDQWSIDANVGTAELPEYIKSMKYELTKKGIEEEEAQKWADKVCWDLGVKDFQIVHTEKGLWIPEKPDWGLNNKANYVWSVTPEEFKIGYMFTYTRAVGGLSASRALDGGYYTNLPGTQYFPPFVQEEINIFITEEGVQYFAWEGIAEKTRVVVDNTELLPFEKIEEELMNQIIYRNTAQPGQQGDTSIGVIECKINSAELQSAYSPAYEKPDCAWLVPTWVFMVQSERTGIVEPIRINAIDGGNIQNSTTVVLE